MFSWIQQQPTRNLFLHCHRLSTITPPSLSTYQLNTQLKYLIQSHRLSDARILFDRMPQRDQITWTTMINGYLHSSNPIESLSIFSQLHSTSSLNPDQFILSLALKASASFPSLLLAGESIHAFSVKFGALPSWVFVSTALLDMYSRNDGVSLNAIKVFDEMPLKNVVSWTAAISALVRAGRFHDAIRCFAEMRRVNVHSDSHTCAIVFKACTDASLLSRGKEAHSHAIKVGLDSASFVANTLATMYSKCGDMAQAVVIFERMHNRDVVSWTSVISTYVQIGRENDAIRAFVTMQSDGVRPNEYTYAVVVSACTGLSDATLGEQLHGHVIHIGFASARSIANTLITFYSRIGQLGSADIIFGDISSKDIVSWSAMISAYAQEGNTEESFFLFAQMRSTGIFPTEFQLASLLRTCACSAMLDAGLQVHALMISVGVESDPKINSALINMYSKCGTVNEAHRAFDELKLNNVVSWTAIIYGYAEHGLSNDAIQLFDKMLDSGLVPDQVAYIGVLTACSHVGLVDLGMKYFEMMRHEHKIEPCKEHYGCVVDLLARAGRLREAEKVINEMPKKADEVVWTTILRACAVHGDTELGQRAAERVLEIDPECAGAHIALSNIYAAKGKWGDAARMRRVMRGKGVRKEAGWSWIGVGDGSVSVFTAGDRLHEREEKIYDVLGLVYFEAMMGGGEVEDVSLVESII